MGFARTGVEEGRGEGKSLNYDLWDYQMGYDWRRDG